MDHRAPPSRLILASASPRRQELLAAAGFTFEVIVAAVEERRGKDESPEDFVRRLATEKAEAIWQRLPQDSDVSILGADTVVVVNSETLGKPASEDDARRMLRQLSGRQHRVLTGVCLLSRAYSGGRAAIHGDVRIASTTVTFLPLTSEEIEEYIATGEPFDKAGAYGIQGRASKFVERIEGCYFNVVGLPVSLVSQMLRSRAK